jgi:preprotein translocase subunit YajC
MGVAVDASTNELMTGLAVMDLMKFGGLIAQADGGQGSAGSPFAMVPAIVVVMVLFYFIMFRPERRKQAAHKALLENLKKNDRVVTIGGIYGLVMSVQRDADEVTLKIDEATNTKIRVTFGAISRVLGEDATGEKSA